MIRLQQVCKNYDQGRMVAVDNIDLEVEPGEFLVVIGWRTLRFHHQPIQSPEANELFEYVGNLGSQAELSLLSGMTNEAGSRAVIQKKLSQLRDYLGCKTASAIENLLIEAVGVAWLDHHLAFIRCNQLSRNATVAMIDHLQKKVDRTQNRYLMAIKTLANVRKMALPTLIQVQANLSLDNGKNVIAGEIDG